MGTGFSRTTHRIRKTLPQDFSGNPVLLSVTGNA
jgi:hypothetical protein